MSSTKRPNIVIFNPDQWRSDVMGHMGNPAARTPNLDRAAKTDFVSFSRAFCQNPVCTPSRCSFMTGWYPHVRGHRMMHYMLRPDEPCLLKILKDSGYFVWWGGKNDLVPAQNGYEKYCDVKNQVGPDTAPWTDEAYPERRGKPGSDTYYSFFWGKTPLAPGQEFYPDWDWQHILAAIDFIRHAPADKPLCIYLPIGYPHPPYAVEDPYFSSIDRTKLPPRIAAPASWDGKPSIVRGIHERLNMGTWTEARWTELRATYYGMCARVDDQFARVMEALRQAGIYDDTAVFFFSDHGDFTGDYGLVEKTENTFEDCLSRVPLLVKPPAAHAVRPRVSPAMVELIDVPATIYDLAQIEPGYTHFGRSLLGLVAGQSDVHRDAVFCEGGRLMCERGYRQRTAKGADDPTTYYWPRVSLEAGAGPEHTKAVMCRTERYKYVRRLYESDELYDLAADPAELHNRINDPALAGPLAALKDRLLRHLLETGDVFPHDPDKRV